MSKFAVNRLLDSVWTLKYEDSGENTVFILTYDRENAIGYKDEDCLLTCRLIESKDRTVVAVDIGEKRFLVSNPQNVFSYHDE